MKRLAAAAATHCGRVREHNEDSYFKGNRVFAVADGMGGNLGGEVASSTALPPIMQLDSRKFSDAAAALRALREAFVAANVAVVSKASEDAGLRGMGATLTTIIVDGSLLHLGHVGDSRAYLVRDGQLRQLTRDHTLVAEMIARGALTAEAAAAHPQRSAITRAVGVQADIDVDTQTIELISGDQILLCSDGLTGPVEQDEILNTLMDEQDVCKAAERLVQLANDHGGPDNVTALLLRYTSVDTAGKRTGPQTPVKPWIADWAQSMVPLRALRRLRSGEKANPVNSRLRNWLQSITLVIVLLGAVALVGFLFLSRYYYLGLEDQTLVIYQGIPVSLGPIKLSRVAVITKVHASQLEDPLVAKLRNGLPAENLADARRIVAGAERHPLTP